MRCPDCGLKTEKVEQLPSKAPFSKRFEETVGESCESAAARRVAKFKLPESTVRNIDLRYLERWSATRKRTAAKAFRSRRNPSGQEDEISDGSEQFGERGTAVVWARAKDRNAG